MAQLLTKTTVVILLGPPGSGKGTQATRLKESMNLPHISTGDLLRQNIAEKTPLGEEARGYIAAGHLVPDSLILDMLFKRVTSADCAKGYILDGFPRTIAQAEALEKRLSDSDTLTVAHFALSDEEILIRIGGRLTCPSCQTPYHRKFAPPKTTDKCDGCDIALIQRPDDQESIVKERLKTYHAQTAPLIAFYTERNHLFTLDCRKNKETIFSELENKLSFS